VSPPIAPNRILSGRYRLLRAVSHTGLATVWEAQHVALASRFTIQVFEGMGSLDGATMQRFLREARVAASVKQRNVLGVVDFGFEPGALEGADPADGAPYLVMELLPGRTLAALLLAETRLPFPRAVDIVAGTLRGLAAVHEAGLVHRGIKPASVFLVEDEDGSFPKLADFGVAELTGGERTTGGISLGAPQYLSPEQLAGSADLDARTDLYAVGVLLYQMLSGRSPFGTGSAREILERARDEAPVPLRTVAAHVPAPIVEVVERAMARDREGRFPDARAMYAALLDAVASASRAASVDVHAATLPPTPMPAVATPAVATPAVVLAPVARPRRPARSAEEGAAPARPHRSEPAAAPRRESAILVGFRVVLLGAITLVVAALVLEGPWSASLGTVTLHPWLSDASVATLDAEISADATVASAAALEMGSFDVGVLDAGPLDAGVSDAGVFDTGVFDSGVLDTGAFDVGAIDATTVDASTEDASLGEADAAALEATPETAATVVAGTDAGIARRDVRRPPVRRAPPRRRARRGR
jgi:hypothetical protein